jgi:hypothetical protein
MSKLSLSRQQQLFFRDMVDLVIYSWHYGWEVTGGELFRTTEQQEIYVKEGKSKTMNSNHLKRLAIDLNFFKDGQYITSKEALQQLGDHWESLNPQNRWGGNYKTFTDTPHFERIPE